MSFCGVWGFFIDFLKRSIDLEFILTEIGRPNYFIFSWLILPLPFSLDKAALLMVKVSLSSLAIYNYDN